MIIEERSYQDYLKALLAGKRFECHELVQNLLGADIEMKVLYTDLFQRSMYEVGELWETNKISVAVEHLATAITESLFSLVYPRIFSAEHIGKKAIISCVANEFHQIGGKMVADIFELNGWDGYFLGANTPAKALLRLIDEKEPDIVGLSLAIYFNMENLLKVIEMIRSNFRNIPLLVGGQAFRWGGTDRLSKYDDVVLVSSLQELEDRMK